MPPPRRVQTIWDSLHDQVQTGRLCDVVFYSNSGSIWAHSCILEGFSPVFSQLFSNRLQNGQHWSIKQPFQISVSNITKCKSRSTNNCMQCLTQVVKYIYTGDIKPTLVHLHHLFILCGRLKNKELLEVCERFQRDHSLLNAPAKTPYIPPDNEIDAAPTVVSSNASCTEVASSENSYQICHKSVVSSESLIDLECKSSSRSPDELECPSQSEHHLECKLCSFVSKDQDMISKHSKVFHHAVYKCMYCSFSNKNIAMLVDHIGSQCFSEEYTICSVCLYKGPDSAALLSHVKTHLSPKPFTCSICKRGFERRSLWLKHSRSHIFKKSFLCTSCPLKFDTDAERYKHYKISHVTKKHVCDECGFSAPFFSVLESHKLKHRKLKISCKAEGCVFQTSSEIMLLRHNSIHKSSSVKRILKSKECSVCSMKFTLTKNLVRHMKTHNSEQRKLKCQLCSYETLRTDKYHEHLSNKHHEREDISNETSSSESLPTKQAVGKQKAREQSPSCSNDKSSGNTSSIQQLRDGYADSPFSQKHNTLMMNDEGDISIVNSNEKNSVTLRNIGNLTGTITLDERTGILTMNNINSGSVFLNETTGELTYINLENDKNIDLNYFNQESVKQVDNFKAVPIPSPSSTLEITKLDEFTGEIIKVSTSSEDNFMPEQEFDSFDMDINDESLDGFDDFDELLFDVFNEEDEQLGSEVVLQNESSITVHPSPMPHLDESTGLLTFDDTLVRSTDSQQWSSYQPTENREMNDCEAYQLLLDEVTGVLHD